MKTLNYILENKFLIKKNINNISEKTYNLYVPEIRSDHAYVEINNIKDFDELVKYLDIKIDIDNTRKDILNMAKKSNNFKNYKDPIVCLCPREMAGDYSQHRLCWSFWGNKKLSFDKEYKFLKKINPEDFNNKLWEKEGWI